MAADHTTHLAGARAALHRALGDAFRLARRALLVPLVHHALLVAQAFIERTLLVAPPHRFLAHDPVVVAGHREVEVEFVLRLLRSDHSAALVAQHCEHPGQRRRALAAIFRRQRIVADNRHPARLGLRQAAQRIAVANDVARRCGALQELERLHLLLGHFLVGRTSRRRRPDVGALGLVPNHTVDHLRFALRRRASRREAPRLRHWIEMTDRFIDDDLVGRRQTAPRLLDLQAGFLNRLMPRNAHVEVLLQDVRARVLQAEALDHLIDVAVVLLAYKLVVLANLHLVLLALVDIVGLAPLLQRLAITLLGLEFLFRVIPRVLAQAAAVHQLLPVELRRRQRQQIGRLGRRAGLFHHLGLEAGDRLQGRFVAPAAYGARRSPWSGLRWRLLRDTRRGRRRSSGHARASLGDPYRPGRRALGSRRRADVARGRRV